jgi:hypothetical protein
MECLQKSVNLFIVIFFSVVFNLINPADFDRPDDYLNP